MILQARYPVAFTGAGISTAAGIQDFRGPGGLYTSGKVDPDLVFEIGYFRRHPEMFYEYTREQIRLLKTVKPTLTHRFLAELESGDRLKGVITQNIDALHRVAGTQKIAEIHGSYWSARCIECGRFKKTACSLTWWEKSISESPGSPVPLCPHCGGPIKPDIVFFGEPVRDLPQAEQMARDSDLMLVLGSSLTVYPAAMLPQVCPGILVVVNQGSVSLSSGKNRCFVESNLDDYFGRVAEAMQMRL